MSFKNIQTTDRSRGVVRITAYRQDYPYIGRVSSVRTQDVAGRLISIQENSYSSRHSSGTRFPYLQRTIQRQYGLTGIYTDEDTGSSETTFVYDQHGNLTTEETISGYGYLTGVRIPLTRSKRVDERVMLTRRAIRAVL